MEASTVCLSLIKWLETFPGVGEANPETLSDGVTLGRVLNIIDGEYFNLAWVSRLKEDCGGNWRLKNSNLRKVQQSVVEYLQYLGVQVSNQNLPDISKIGEKSSFEDVGKMLQLILGCAMNCTDKEIHIESIMGMPAEVQAVVMNTLQTVFVKESSPGVEFSPPGPASFHPNHRTITEQLESTTKARDEAVARVHELEMQLSEVTEERKELKYDNNKLLEKLEGQGDNGDGPSTNTGTASRYKDLKKKIDSLQDDLFKVETSRDEYRVRVEHLEREHTDMVLRTEELQKLADQAHILQDEVDVLRDMGQRATQAETTIESYKKKLDELSDLRRQNKMLEEKNADYMQHILELEEDVKKNDSWRPQLELFKKQTGELRQLLAEETKKADRLSFDNKKLNEKVEAITLEKDRMSVERDGLREQFDELKCQKSVHLTDPRTDLPLGDLLGTSQQDVWEKLMRLQHENQQLKKQQTDGPSEPVLQAMVTDLNERHDSVTAENRQLNQRIMELESEMEDLRGAGITGVLSSIPNLGASGGSGAMWNDNARKEMERKLAHKNEELSQFQETILKREGEMAAMEERYKRYLNKAKSVIKSLDPKYNPSIIPADHSVLRQQLMDKDKRIDNMEKDAEKAKMIRDVEEKLITTAFYNYGMNMHRQMVNNRLAAIEQGQHNSQMKQRNSLGQRRAGNRSSGSGSHMDEMRFS